MPWTDLFKLIESGITAWAGGTGTLPWLLVGGLGSWWTFYYTVKHL